MRIFGSSILDREWMDGWMDEGGGGGREGGDIG